MTGNITLIARTVPNRREVTAPSRPVTESDSAALAQLLVEAYGTRVEGEQDKAEALVRDAFAGAYGPFLAEQSQLIEDEDAPRRLAGYLINRLADGVRTRTQGRQTELRLSFRD